MRKFLLGFITLIITITMDAQDWRQMMQDPNANFYDIQKAANTYFKKHVNEEQERARRIQKGKTVKEESAEEEFSGYEQYKRWEAFMEPRVYPSGDLSLPSQTWKNYEVFLLQNNSGNKVISPNMISSTTWTAMGPFGAMTGSACGLPRKAGRDNFITFNPTVTTTYWVGAPAGGLWKTTNDGVTWNTNTDNLSVIGCSDLAIDPTNTNIMYLATGDGDAGDTYCIGVLKSTDGGNTWNTTGLVWTVNQQRTMRRLIINPSNPQVLIAASNAGIWRTTNGGTTWTQVSTIDAYDVEFKPTDPNTVYAGGGATGTTHSFYLSTNGGASFSVISNGIPTSACTRINIAVTTADPNYVYVLRSNTSYNFGGLYRSTASGTVFTSMSTTPDVICNACTGVASGNGQGWYDLSLAASPLNRDEVVAAGVNHWRSTDGGSTWTNIGCWNSTAANPPYVHADVHEVEYNSAGTLYSCNDGAIYKYTGTSWTDLASPRNIAQQYRIGLSGITPDYWITGHQDNGTNVYNGTTYSAKYCGDGMDCFIDRTNNNNMFGATPGGGFILSTNAGTSWASAQTGMTGAAAWVAPWHQDPVTATTLYAGRSQMFVSTNSGNNWTQLTATGGSGNIVEFAVAPSNNQVIYVIHNTSLFKTTNGGSSWTNVTTGITGSPTYVAIDPTDANNAWVTISGYSGGNKVFVTTNGGTSWTNVSLNLPNLPANCIVYEPGTNDRVYIGMDVGVYYKDNSMGSWTLYNAGLPNVPISDLEISPANPTKLYAATYGRGTYKVDLVVSAAPVSTFSVASAGLCSGSNIAFTDQSINSPTSWSWSVTPSAGVTVTTPTLQNPTMNFSTAGTYTVSMQATNGVGPGSVATQTVTIVGTPTVNVTIASQTVCAGSPVSFTASGATTYSWTSGGGTGTVATYTPSAMTVYTVTGTTSGCSGVRTSTAYVNASPTVAVTGATAVCIGSSAVLAGSGASTYTWSTGPTTTTISVSPTVTTTYSVAATGTNGCLGSASRTVVANALPIVSVTGPTVVCIGSSAILTGNGASTYTWNIGPTTTTISVSPTVTTNYSVAGTGTNGCTNTTTATLSVNALPSITASSSSSVICAGQSVTLTGVGGSTYTWNPGSITGTSVVFTPTSTTNYSVVGTGTNGCNNSATKNVTVNPTPTVNTVASSSVICLGQTTTLTANGASTYSWSTGATTGSISVSPTITTSYSVTGTGTTSCSNTSVRTITVNPLPVITASSSSTIICTGQTATLTANGASTYTWNPGGTGASVVVSPTTTTTYSISGTATTNCSNTSMLTLSVSACTGIEQIVNAGVYSIFPNPTTGKLTIQAGVTKSTVITAEVVDATGKLVMKQSLNFDAADNSESINISNLANGLYFVKLTNSDNKTETIRIVKE